MQLFIGHDKDFRSAFPLERFKALPFFVLEQTCHRGMRPDDNSLLLAGTSNLSTLAEDFVGHRGR